MEHTSSRDGNVYVYERLQCGGNERAQVVLHRVLYYITLHYIVYGRTTKNSQVFGISESAVPCHTMCKIIGTINKSY